MNEKEKIKQFTEMLDLEYPNPPRNVGKLLKKTINNTKGKIYSITKGDKVIAIVLIIYETEFIYSIYGIITRKEYRNNGSLQTLACISAKNGSENNVAAISANNG